MNSQVDRRSNQMQNSLPDLLKSLYIAACCGGFLLACVAVVTVSRRSSVSQNWLPLVPIVNGELERTYRRARLRGMYQQYPIQATLILGGAEDPDTFHIEMTIPPGGTDWSIQYGSEKLLGKDEWYVKTPEEGVQQQLIQSGVLAEMQRWESHPTISYRAQSGTLIYEERVNIPQPERFQAQLDLLLRIAEMNTQVNKA